MSERNDRGPTTTDTSGADGEGTGGDGSAGNPGPPLDLVVVGAGPCGIAAGVAARREGLHARLFDAGPLTASLVEYPPYMTFFSSAENLEIGDVPFVVARGKPGREEALAYYRRVVERYELDVHQHEPVTGLEGSRGDFRIRTRTRDGDRRRYRAGAVVVATGSFHAPNLLEVPGEELEKVRHHYDEPHPYWDQDVVVVGGGNSAVEATLELWRAGARVTLVHFAHELDPGVKPWIRPDLENRIEEGSVPVRWGTRIDRIEPRSVVLRDVDTDGTEEIPNDRVFALTGWHSDPTLLREIGVEVDDETGVPLHDATTMETNIPGVYVAGVLAAGDDANRIFIENGKHHGRRVVAHLTGGKTEALRAG